jgi:APA family basic amino acid/polyamine antiporter
LFVFRRRDSSGADSRAAAPATYRAPGHPYTTIVFIAISWFVVANTIYKYPGNTLAGIGILLAGIPVYYIWRWRNAARS